VRSLSGNSTIVKVYKMERMLLHSSAELPVYNFTLHILGAGNRGATITIFKHLIETFNLASYNETFPCRLSICYCWYAHRCPYTGSPPVVGQLCNTSASKSPSPSLRDVSMSCDDFTAQLVKASKTPHPWHMCLVCSHGETSQC